MSFEPGINISLPENQQIVSTSAKIYNDLKLRR